MENTQEQTKASKRLWDATNERDSAESAYLRAFGWRYSSSHPGSLWLWEREFDGKRVTADTKVAVQITKSTLDDGE